MSALQRHDMFPTLLRCRQSNKGQPLYLCRACTRTLHAHPLLRRHNIQFFSGDRDDVLSVSRCVIARQSTRTIAFPQFPAQPQRAR